MEKVVVGQIWKAKKTGSVCRVTGAEGTNVILIWDDVPEAPILVDLNQLEEFFEKEEDNAS